MAVSPPPDADPPALCVLEHARFAAFGTLSFRRAAADGAPVMIVHLGDREAALPLRSIQKEFGIADESADGHMLCLIAEALDFVGVLRPGDPLPSEILSGRASWAPDPVHVAIATMRLKLQMVAWITTGSGGDRIDLTPDSLLRLAGDSALRVRVQTALTRAAREMRLAGPDQVLSLMEVLGEELSFIEALRERLLNRLSATVAKIERLAAAWKGDSHQSESVSRVRRLAGIALRQTARRFEDVDAQTGEVLAALRNQAGQRGFIRSQRDWLYRSLRGWEPIFSAWDAAGTEFDQATVALIGRTYQFLAPRFMPVTEWLSRDRPGQRRLRPGGMGSSMVW